MTFTKEEIERARQVSEEKYQLDLQSKLVHAEREGFRQGIQEALQEALREGRQNDVKEIARMMERRGISAENIAKDTGLTLKQVSELSPKVVTITKEEIERARQISEEKYQLDLQSMTVYAEQEARKEGRQQVKMEVARKMKSRGIAAEQIAEDTGLTLKQIEDLK